MEKKRTIQRGKNRKKSKPKIRFNFGVLLFLFVLSFAGCFAMYMVAVNVNPDFLAHEFGETSPVTSGDVSKPAEDSGNKTADVTETVVNTVTNPVPAGEAAPASYFENACLITDATLIKMDIDGKFAKANIFGSDRLNAANCGTFKVDSNFGNDNVYEIVKSKKPEVLYIMLGSDMGTSAQDDMIAAYTSLVTNLHASLPELKVYIMQYPPVIYDSETLTNELVNTYNKKLLAIADAVGVYCIDTNTVLKGENGALEEKYWSYDEQRLSSAAYKVICDYILTHVV